MDVDSIINSEVANPYAFSRHSRRSLKSIEFQDAESRKIGFGYKSNWFTEANVLEDDEQYAQRSIEILLSKSKKIPSAYMSSVLAKSQNPVKPYPLLNDGN